MVGSENCWVWEGDGQCWDGERDVKYWVGVGGGSWVLRVFNCSFWVVRSNW